MSITEIHMPDELDARVAAAVKRAGTDLHCFILEAITEKIDREEPGCDFHNLADQRYEKIVATGKTIPWDQMRRRLEDRLAKR